MFRLVLQLDEIAPSSTRMTSLEFMKSRLERSGKLCQFVSMTFNNQDRHVYEMYCNIAIQRYA